MIGMPRMKVTLKEWAESRGYDLDTVKGWRKRLELEFPTAVEWRGGGPTPYWWDADLDRWKKGHPTLGLGRGGHKRKAE
jgi:hypothetical protein